MCALLASHDVGFPADDLLGLWEVGAAQHPLDRAITILAAAEPGLRREELARLPCGRRDERLLRVYERAFGSQLVGQGHCPDCQAHVEFALDVRDLLAAAGDAGPAEPWTVEADGYSATCRLPDSFDLAAIAGMSDVTEAREALVRRCVVQASREGAEVAPQRVPEDFIALVAEGMEARDPLAAIELKLECPVCGARWQLTFDIVPFIWLRVEAQARRLLHEVHSLASAYGWREVDILAMTPDRRQAYLEMVSSCQTF